MKSLFRKIKRYIFYRTKLYLPRSKKDSIFFFTFHKCASTLFSTYVLKNINGLYNIDYANYLSDKPNSFKKQLNFQKRGIIYGPIRLSARGELVYNLLIKPTSDLEFVKDKTAIFFIRDPRDILVSAYYSFGSTHSLNSVKEKRNKQLERRKKIQSLSIDEYVLEFADQQIEYFDNLKTIAAICNKKIILRYEDMIENFDSFITDFKAIADIDENVIQNIYKKSRPKKNIDNTSHHRSGKTKRYIKELKPETIKFLNNKLEKTLYDFNYTELKKANMFVNSQNRIK